MTKQTVAFIAGAFLVLTFSGQRVLYAGESHLGKQYISRKEGKQYAPKKGGKQYVARKKGKQYVSREEYEKLKQELEALKTQMRVLLQDNREVAPDGVELTGISSLASRKPHSNESTFDALGSKKTSLQLEPKPALKVAQAQTRPAEAGQPAESIAPGNREKEAEEAKRQLDEFLRRQRLLFKPGELEFEFGLSYSQDDSERLIPIAGGIVTQSGSRFANASLTTRYGLAEDLELDFSVPFGYSEQSLQFFTARRLINSAAGLGDVSGALRYAARREDGFWPEVVLSLTGKSTSGDEERRLGSGHWNVGGAATLVKTIDPVVFFGSVGYTAALEQDEIDPGDQIPYSLGMGFSLNDRVSFLMSLAGAVVRRTEVRGRELPSQQINTLQFSTTVQLARRLFLEPFVGIGLTKDSADFLVGINIPYRLGEVLPLPFFGDQLEN